MQQTLVSNQKTLSEYLSVQRKDLPVIGGPLFAYFFRRICQKEFHSVVGDREVSRSILETFRNNGDVLRNYKLYAWMYYRHRFSKCAKPIAKDFGVPLTDASFLRRLNLDHLSLKYPSHSIKEFESIVQDTLNCSHMQQHLGKLVSKKMIFLVRSYGMTREDIEMDLKAKAVRAIYLAYPKYESLSHLSNIAKTTIHNTAMTMIKSQTCESRNKLYKNERGEFQAVHEDIGLHLNRIINPESSKSSLLEDMHVISQLFPRMKPEVQRFLLCCAVQFDPEFSDYLEADNSEIVESMGYTRYLAKSRKFFGITQEQNDKIFLKLRGYLQP